MQMNWKSLFLAVGMTAAPLAAADVNGTWKFDGDVQGNPVKMECAFKQDGDKFKAACKSGAGDERNFDGVIEDGKVRFSFDVLHDGNTYTLVFTGAIKEDKEISGDINLPAAGITGNFTAKKAA